jgi:hypothetical protein
MHKVRAAMPQAARSKEGPSAINQPRGHWDMLNRTQDQKAASSGLSLAIITYFRWSTICDHHAPGVGYIPFITGLRTMLLAVILVIRDVRRNRENCRACSREQTGAASLSRSLLFWHIRFSCRTSAF